MSCKKFMILTAAVLFLSACRAPAVPLRFEASPDLRALYDASAPAHVTPSEGQRLWEAWQVLLAQKHLRVAAVGDIMLGRRVGRLLDEHGSESAYEAFSFLFEGADEVFGNLECSLSDRGRPLLGKGIWLRADPDKAEVLKTAGFTVVSLANNHILDYGNDALFDTLSLLDAAGIGRAGAGRDIVEARRPYRAEKGGVRLGLLAYHEFSYLYWSFEEKRRFAAEADVPGTAPMDLAPMLEDVRALSKETDIVAVSLHWGVEESNRTTEAQRRTAHALIDVGADVVLGHHPHVIQGVEIYRGKPVFYSLGNYLFDQNDENNKQGMAVALDYFEGRLAALQIHPLYIQDKRTPLVPEGALREAILDKISRLSADLGTVLERDGEKLVLTFPGPQ